MNWIPFEDKWNSCFQQWLRDNKNLIEIAIWMFYFSAWYSQVGELKHWLMVCKWLHCQNTIKKSLKCDLAETMCCLAKIRSKVEFILWKISWKMTFTNILKSTKNSPVAWCCASFSIYSIWSCKFIWLICSWPANSIRLGWNSLKMISLVQWMCWTRFSQKLRNAIFSNMVHPDHFNDMMPSVFWLWILFMRKFMWSYGFGIS